MYLSGINQKTLKMSVLNPNSKSYLAGVTPMLRIYKEGRTVDGPVTIFKKDNEPFDLAQKIEFFKSLGYAVTEI